MDCKRVEAELIAFELAILDGATRAALEAHLVGCGRCVGALLAVKRAIDAGEDVGEGPSAAARARILADGAARLAHATPAPHSPPPHAPHSPSLREEPNVPSPHAPHSPSLREEPNVPSPPAPHSPSLREEPNVTAPREPHLPARREQPEGARGARRARVWRRRPLAAALVAAGVLLAAAPLAFRAARVATPSPRAIPRQPPPAPPLTEPVDTALTTPENLRFL